MSDTAKRPATYADIEAAPEHLVAEIIEGELVTRRGGLLPVAAARSSTIAILGRRGPLAGKVTGRPEVHQAGNVLVPDIAVWPHDSDDEVRAPPFEAISFSLADLWPLDKPLGFNEDPTPLYAGDR